FASGDGTAYVNNRSGSPVSVRPVRMSEKDYVFTIDALPAPRADAELKVAIVPHPGDSFPTAELIRTIGARAEITIPWKTRAVADTAVLARSYQVYWNDPSTRGVAASATPRAVRVTLLSVDVKNPQ